MLLLHKSENIDGGMMNDETPTLIGEYEGRSIFKTKYTKML